MEHVAAICPISHEPVDVFDIREFGWFNAKQRGLLW
jgi:hypothetical protein